MEAFVARQPIFDRIGRVYGYELYFRSGLGDLLDRPASRQADPESDRASLKVIGDTFFLFGVETMTGGRKAFIPLTRDTLVKGYASILPKELTVIELPEGLEPDAEVVEACRASKEAGHLLALSGPALREDGPLFDLADIGIVDFAGTPMNQRLAIAQRCAPREIKLLAGNLDAEHQFSQAKLMGYTYFQGPHFSKPKIVAAKDVPTSRLTQLQLLQEINQTDLDIDRVEEIIKREVSLSYKLLKYINSASFGLRVRIRSVKHALTLLGQAGIRTWASVIVLTDMGIDEPFTLGVNSVVRARFGELLAERLAMKYRAQDFFLMGLFSMMDVIVGLPLSYVLAGLPLAEDIKAALLGEDLSSRPRKVYELILAYEQGDWGRVSELAGELDVNEGDLPKMWLDALAWSNEIIEVAQ